MIGTVDSDAGKERRGREGGGREDVSAKLQVAPRFSCGKRKGSPVGSLNV